MSKNHRHRPSLKGDPNAVTTAPTEQHQEAPNEPMQERPMEAVQEKTQEVSAETEKLKNREAADREEALQAQAIAQVKALNDAAEGKAGAEPLSLLTVAASGRDKLADAFKEHNRKVAENKKEYVPPAMTARQLANREEEFAAGRAASERAAAQLASRPQPKTDLKEGFTSPMYRPGDAVPDPMLMTNGSTPMSVAGTGKYDPDK
jgi:hypothetical protein